MTTFLYTAWFENLNAPIDDEDHEWCACFLIEAESEARAKTWGDHLATNFSSRWTEEKFLWSEIEGKSDNAWSGEEAKLPRITDGYVASDKEIGW